ncbi:hypothetical protein ALQ97_200056 [Pseudomonas savastanoi pv. glycinea]|nr:hypothetical protein ALQ97_200056 [Pseudomonas savastanoi pv. glycinea]
MVVLLRGLADGVLGRSQCIHGLLGLGQRIRPQREQGRRVQDRNAWHCGVGSRQGGGQHERAHRISHHVFFHDETSISLCS